MQNILKAIELKSELDSLRPLNKDQESKIMQKFRLDWNYHSNHLEGNSLTFGETKNLILHGITAQGKPLKDHFEITGHNEALNLVIDIVKDQRPITENFIRELHELLLKEPYYVDAITPEGTPTKKLIQVGKYKTSPNHIKTSTGEIFRFAEPEETPAKMHDLLEWYKFKRTEKDVNPIILAAEFHYKFIIIHPFDDGNGRLARILMNFILMSFNYPPVIIKTDDKQNYFFALRQSDNKDYEFFIDYIAKNLIRSLEIMIAGAKGESIEDPDDIDKEISLLEHKLKGIGKEIENLKSHETILNILQNSIKPFFTSFINSCEKFKKFYSKTDLVIMGNPIGIYSNISFETLEYLVKEEKKSIDNVSFQFSFLGFKNNVFDEFNYESIIQFNFKRSQYEVNSSYSKTLVRNSYNINLTEDEVKEITNFESKKHHSFIEQKIKEFENKNNSKK